MKLKVQLPSTKRLKTTLHRIVSNNCLLRCKVSSCLVAALRFSAVMMDVTVVTCSNDDTVFIQEGQNAACIDYLGSSRRPLVPSYHRWRSLWKFQTWTHYTAGITEVGGRPVWPGTGHCSWQCSHCCKVRMWIQNVSREHSDVLCVCTWFHYSGCMLVSGVTRTTDHIVILITWSCDREMQLMKVSKFTVFQRHTTDQRQRSQDCPVQNLIAFPQAGPQPQPGCQTWTPEWWPLTSEPVISCCHCIGDASVSLLDWDLHAVSMQRPSEGPLKPYWWKVGRWIGMVGRCKCFSSLPGWIKWLCWGCPLVGQTPSYLSERPTHSL